MSDEELDDDPHQGSEKQDGVMTIENGGLMFKPNAAGSEPSMQHMRTLMRQERANAIVVPAVYHHEIRKELLASAPTGTYGELLPFLNMLTGASADEGRLPRRRF